MSEVTSTWKVKDSVELIAKIDGEIYEIERQITMARQSVELLRINQRSVIKRLRRIVELNEDAKE